MLNETKDVVLVCNGEIYNYITLRENLIKKGHKFKSKSDSEVILHAYVEWGEDFINKLEGMFAGAVCSEDVSKGKPDPEVFLKAAQLINLDPQVCFVFEDSTHGIEAAVHAGMIPIGITTTNPNKISSTTLVIALTLQGVKSLHKRQGFS